MSKMTILVMLTFNKQESIAVGCIPVTKVASTVGEDTPPLETLSLDALHPSGYPTGHLTPWKDLVLVIPYPLLWTDEHLRKNYLP